MKKQCLFLMVMSALVIPLFPAAEETGLLSKTVASISEKLVAREYEKAFSYVEFLFKLNKNDSMPQEAIDISGQAVEQYSQDLLARKKWQEIANLAGRLSGAPLAVQARAKEPIFRATAELTAQEETRNARKRAALAAAKAAEDKKKTLLVTPAPAAANDAESTAVAAPREIALIDLRSDIEELRTEETRRDADLRASIIVLCAAFIVFFLACVVAFWFSFVGYRNSLEKRAAAAGGYYDACLPFPVLGASEDIEKLCDGFSEEEIESLLRICASAGRFIDNHTQRGNNSRRISELVYAISLRMGYSHKAASFFSAAGMIRDIGLLSVDVAVFGSPQATEEELGRLRCHVKDIEPALLLIDERMRPTLVEGISRHHENLDGSGYAEMAKGKRIPYLARVLRVTESYVSLVSKSNYHRLRNTQEAIEEMRGLSTWYDASLLVALADEV